jgi:dTMP kinase
MINNSYPGKFIVLEGLDGSGQSTQVSLLGDFFIKKDKEVVLTKEPTRDSEAGKNIKKILEEKIETDPIELQKLYVQDRKEHLEKVVIPALRQGKIVISDRYFFSTFAFGSAHGADLEELIKMNNNFLYPDLVFFLKVDAKTCIERIEKRADPKTLFEKEERLVKVAKAYENIALRFENIKIIDAKQPIEKVFEQIKLNL